MCADAFVLGVHMSVDTYVCVDIHLVYTSTHVCSSIHVYTQVHMCGQVHIGMPVNVFLCACKSKDNLNVIAQALHLSF